MRKPKCSKRLFLRKKLHRFPADPQENSYAVSHLTEMRDRKTTQKSVVMQDLPDKIINDIPVQMIK